MNNFSYVRATSVAEALHAIDTPAGVQNRFLAGGTTLVDLMRLDVMPATRIVDITSIPELQTYDVNNPSELVFGSLVKMSDAAADPAIARDYPAISESLWRAASQQLRNMATLGGNLLQRTRCEYFRDVSYPCNKRNPGSGCAAIDGLNRGHAIFGYSDSCIATYPSDFAIALAAFDAQVDTISPRGERTIALLDLHRLPGDTPHIETVLEPDELIVRIRVPRTAAGPASTYQKIRDRESYAFATVSFAVALQIEGGIIKEARIALGGVATKPWRAWAAERGLVGQPMTQANAESAATLAFADAKPRKSSAFKMALGPAGLAKSLMIAAQRNER